VTTDYGSGMIVKSTTKCRWLQLIELLF
jgi:hypothetical protein